MHQYNPRGNLGESSRSAAAETKRASVPPANLSERDKEGKFICAKCDNKDADGKTVLRGCAQEFAVVKFCVGHQNIHEQHSSSRADLRKPMGAKLPLKPQYLPSKFCPKWLTYGICKGCCEGKPAPVVELATVCATCWPPLGVCNGPTTIEDKRKMTKKEIEEWTVKCRCKTCILWKACANKVCSKTGPKCVCDFLATEQEDAKTCKDCKTAKVQGINRYCTDHQWPRLGCQKEVEVKKEKKLCLKSIGILKPGQVPYCIEHGGKKNAEQREVAAGLQRVDYDADVSTVS